MSEKKLKNIIFIMSDQHRYDYVSYHGLGKMKTPNIDRIAGSVGFTNAISVNPVCSPARTALLTGKYSHQIGTLFMRGDLSLQHPTYLQALQKKGYHTAGIGKFHFCYGPPTDDGKGYDLVAMNDIFKRYGFDHIWQTGGKSHMRKVKCHYGEHLEKLDLLDAYREHVISRWPPGRRANEEQAETSEPFPFDEKDYVDILTGNEVLKAIDHRPSDKPFFVFASFCCPHFPYDPPKRYLDMIPYKENDDFLTDIPIAEKHKKTLYKKRQAYKAMIKLVDDQVGRIFDKLENENLLEDTVIIFTTDHGEMMGDHYALQKRSPFWQSVKIPLAILHPDYKNNLRINSPIEITDITATILDIAGIDPQCALSKEYPAFNNIVPAKSLLPILEQKTDKIRDYAFSESYGLWEMIQSKNFKYIKYLEYDDPDHPNEAFYNLQDDPNELKNLIDSNSLQKEVNWHRRRLEFIKDKTPAAQYRWAPTQDNRYKFEKF